MGTRTKIGMVTDETVDDAWPALVHGSVPAPEPPALSLVGAAPPLTTALPVASVATASVATALRAAGALLALRNAAPPRLTLHRGHVVISVQSERHFTVDGQPAGMGFAPLSRFWRAADGWVRTHANYPWHRRALLSTLECDDDEQAVAAAIRERAALDVEATVMAAGGVAAAVRTRDEWRAHPQGAAVAREPLISHTTIPGAEPRRRGECDLPARGVRVLDMTRVIAGPVCTRYLAALGADVLRIDPPHRPDMAASSVGDTLFDKRSAFLDLTTSRGTTTLNALVDAADVLVSGYRPGALDRFGLTEHELAERHPGLVVVFVSAWGHSGPWADRRGFDSVVQAPTGIARMESTDGTQPGALPCQLLDHGTGYLAAAAALDSIRRQTLEGGTHVRRVSLARTACWLTSTTQPTATPSASSTVDASPWLQQLSERGETITGVRPPGQIDDVPLRWSRPGRYGDDEPSWPSR